MTLLVDGELVLYGFVGDSYWNEGFTARQVLDALAEHGRGNDLVVRINSGGGYTDDGVAIYNALIAHKGKVTTIVDAMAASSASIVFMAGTDRIMRTGALMMIHDPSGMTFGTADAHRKNIELLDRLADQMAGIYADTSGGDEAAIRAEMKAELWLTPEEAVGRGFATSADDAASETVAAFDYRFYAHSPEPLRAMAKANGWTFSDVKPKAAATAPAPPEPTGDPNMSEKSTADALAAATEAGKSEGAKAAQERIKAIMTSPEAKGRETLAEHFAYSTQDSAEAAIAAMTASPKASTETVVPPVDPVDPKDPKAVAEYQASRATAAGLAAPGGQQKGKSGLTARIDRHIEQSKRG
jgi:ATP-dependent protease ClpP protease subunit